MVEFDEARHRAAYEGMRRGDPTLLGTLLAEDVVQHIVDWDLTVHGRQRTVELVSRIFDRFAISDYSLDRVEVHGEFVVNYVSARSALLPERFSGVDVVRVGADGLAVESWSHRPRLPDGIDVRQALDWQD